MKSPKNIFLLVIITIMLASVLSGCGCEHKWQAATCLTPRTCTLCGQTEGKLRSHEWGSTACDAPEGCVVCGTLEGIELSHEWGGDGRICVRCGYDGRSAEERLPEALAAGLEEKWRIETELKNRDSKGDSSLTAEDWRLVLEAEYSCIASFKEEKFEDETVKELALSYIGSIENAMALLENFSAERWEDEYFSSIYLRQAEMLYLLNSQHPIIVEEEYGESIKELLTDGEVIHMVRPLLEQILFLHVESTESGERYETTVENSSSLTFSWFSLDINLLDDSGNVLARESIKIHNWEPGEKRRFSFTATEEFAGIDVAFANWQLPNY